HHYVPLWNVAVDLLQIKVYAIRLGESLFDRSLIGRGLVRANILRPDDGRSVKNHTFAQFVA
ncbi:hypothetical protein, partial [Alistipes ihumii]|uniref:hypothetical protein n=1 Tax=Alistipes ihumii TaxID=1470347 RepID=UPI003AB4CF6B